MEPSRIPVPPGCIAAVVTYLQMVAPPDRSESSPPDGIEFVRVHEPDTEWYRRLYRSVGEDWLWFSRLLLRDSELSAVIRDPLVEVWVARRDGAEIGLVELDWRIGGECELVFFGLVADEVGRGLGRWMLRAAIRQAWRPGVRRFWLHTCTLDHPAAVPFYCSEGFVPYRREVEIDPDPRLAGAVRHDAARFHPPIA